MKENKSSGSLTLENPQSLSWKPLPYMRKALKFVLSQGAAGLFLEPGLGKTSIMLAATSWLLEKNWNVGVLVIAPLRPCYSVWPKEVEKWKDFNHLTVNILHGPHKSLHHKAAIYVINPEGLPWLERELKNFKKKEWPFDVLIVDESSKFRNTNTKRFKLLKPMIPNFTRRYVLTGTPAPKSYLNLFGQIFILDVGAALGRYITHFRNEYFDKTGFGGYTYVPKPDAHDRINKKIKPLVISMVAMDYVDLPPMNVFTIEVELPPKARKTYKSMELLLFADLDAGKVTAVNAAVASSKCRQIANGAIYTNDKHDWEIIHDSKLVALVDLVDELEGQPVLIAYEYKHELQLIKAALKEAGYGDVPHIGGGVSAKEGAKLEREWNAGDLPVLLGHPQSIGLGLNLQEAGKAIIHYSPSWDWELNKQFNDRLMRTGRKMPLFIYYLIANNTLDGVALSNLDNNQKRHLSLLDALRAYRRRK